MAFLDAFPRKQTEKRNLELVVVHTTIGNLLSSFFSAYSFESFNKVEVFHRIKKIIEYCWELKYSLINSSVRPACWQKDI